MTLGECYYNLDISQPLMLTADMSPTSPTKTVFLQTTSSQV